MSPNLKFRLLRILLHIQREFVYIISLKIKLLSKMSQIVAFEILFQTLQFVTF
jgi:hypothetical protein